MKLFKVFWEKKKLATQIEAENYTQRGREDDKSQRGIYTLCKQYPRRGREGGGAATSRLRLHHAGDDIQNDRTPSRVISP